MKKYIDNQIKWMKRYSDSEISAIRETVDKIKDQSSNFVTRNELLAAVVATIAVVTWIISFMH